MRRGGKRARDFAEWEKAVERYRKLPSETIRYVLTRGYQLMPKGESAYRKVLEERGEVVPKKSN